MLHLDSGGCATTSTEPMTKTQKGGLLRRGGRSQPARYSVRSSDVIRGYLIGAAIGAAVGGLGGAGVGKMMDNQEKGHARRSGHLGSASVSRDGNLLAVTFKGDVTFDTNSAEVRPGLYSEINRVAGVLTQYPDTFIRVDGHTDSVGSDAYNMDLSVRRANSVKDLLVQRGIAPDRIEVMGFGETMPVATNDTEAGRQLNRRVEIKIAPQTQSQTPQ